MIIKTYSVSNVSRNILVFGMDGSRIIKIMKDWIYSEYKKFGNIFSMSCTNCACNMKRLNTAISFSKFS